MIGTQIGRYRIDDELGRGGMGVVYRGTQVTLDRTVAIKMLPAHLADSDNQDRFRREALTLARLAHPNIVHIYDVEEEDGHSFIMMEHVGGGSLGDRMRSDSPFSATRAVEVMGPVLSALHAAHLAGVVHRDIKPDNILFTETGRPKLTDFGIAHMRDSGSRTRTGVMLGTPYYMSPEQARGRPVSAAADLYAVGVVLYEMLSGQVPFTGEDPLSVALKHVQEAPRPLRELRPDLPIELCDLVHRALRKEPEARFTSAAAMQDALQSGGWAGGRNTLDPGTSGASAGVPPGIAGDRQRHDEAAGTAAANSGATSTPRGAPSVEAAPVSASLSGAASASAPESQPDSVPGPASDTGGRAEVASDPPAATDLPAGSAAARLSGAATALTTSTGATLRWLATPAWRGYPRAFWAGATALALAVAWLGAATIADNGAADPESLSVVDRASGTDGGSADPNTPGSPTSGPAGGSSIGPRGAGTLESAPSGPDLSEEDRAALRDLVRGDPEEANDPEDVVADPASSDPLDRISSEEPGPLTLDDLRTPEPEGDRAPTDGDLVRAIVERQLRAVEQSDRALFLRDFHSDVRAEAAAEFDAATGATDIRSTISNLSIEFPEPDHAFVTFDVALSFTVRADGRTLRESYEEMWDLRREGDRWWIIAWN